MQYEASKPELENLLSENSGLSEATKQALQDVINSGTAVIAQSSATAETITSEAIVTEKGAELNDVEFSGTTTMVFDETTGNAVVTTDEAVTADLQGGDLSLDIQNDQNNTVNLANTTGASVQTGEGDDTFTIESGEASVNTGEGNDSVDLRGVFTGKIVGGSGDLELTLDETAQEQATVSVDAGEGFDMLRLLGGKIQHRIEVIKNGFVLHSGEVTLNGVQLIATDMNSDGNIDGNDHITVLATNENDSLVTKLYKVALGREAIDGEDGWGGSTLGGINWWMNQFENQSYNDGTVETLVKSFLNCTEFHNKYDSMSDEDYVKTLLQNADKELSDDLVAGYVEKLENGSTREDVAYQVVQTYNADEDHCIKITGTDGNEYTILVEGFES